MMADSNECGKFDTLGGNDGKDMLLRKEERA